MTDPNNAAVEAAQAMAVGMRELSGEFAAERAANETKISTVERVVTRLRRITRWVLVGVVLDICLTVAVGFGYAAVHSAAQRATAATSAAKVASRAQYSQCLSTNGDRAATIKLWTQVLSISVPATPAEAKKAADFKAYLDQNFSPLECKSGG